MKKKDIIKSPRDFTEIINNGTLMKNKAYRIYYQKSNDKNRYGISVPTKTEKAVIRNKIKRRVKNIIDNNKNMIKKSYNYVIIIRKVILDLSYIEMEKELLNLINKIGD